AFRHLRAPTHATPNNFRAAGLRQQAVDQSVDDPEPLHRIFVHCGPSVIGQSTGMPMMLVRGNAKTDGPVHMPDKWLPAQLNLTALTPFKAFAPITTAVAMAFLSSTAMAETTEERQACFSDAFRVCWSAIPDRNAVFHCLMDNRPRLNPACRTVMDQYRREHRIRRASRNARAD